MTIPRLEGAAQRQAQQRLEALSRTDKWYLSASDGFVWAPPQPHWAAYPGFWDPARAFDYSVGPLFTVSLVGEDGDADVLDRAGYDWRPDRLRIRWRSRTGLALTEFRYVLPGGRFCSAWRTEEELGWPNPVFRTLSLVAHTALAGDEVRDLAHATTGLSWSASMVAPQGSTLPAGIRMSVSLLPPRGHHAVSAEDVDCLQGATADTCTGAYLSQGEPHPSWDRSPFVESWHARDRGIFRGQPTLPAASGELSAHLALVLPLHAVPARYGVGFVCMVTPELGRPHTRLWVPPPPPAPDLSEARWRGALADFPRFQCSDPFLSGYYDYRIYSLFLNRLEPRGRINHPCFAEGVGEFHTPTAPAAACHAREARWSRDPAPARGSVLNFLEAQHGDGRVPGHLFVDDRPDPGILWANWADAALAVDVLHPQQAFVSRVYGALSRFATWVLQQRDPEGSGLITVSDPSETGKEHSARFPDEDPATYGTFKGVVATTFTYRLCRALELMAERMEQDEKHLWSVAAERIAEAMLSEMWDPDVGLFFDVAPEGGGRTGVRSVVCFYPLLTDVPGEAHVARLLEHLQDPGGFGAPFPVPSLAMDDPLFSAEGLWRGTRHDRPWNGRVWPSAASHLMEGLLRQWRLGHRSVGPTAAATLRSFIQMMHFDGDPDRPNALEHYNPLTGHGSIFRGLDDHVHAWILDLLVRGVTGVQPERSTLVVDPLPMGLESASFRGTLRGQAVHVRVRGDTVEVDMNGTRHASSLGEVLEIPW